MTRSRCYSNRPKGKNAPKTRVTGARLARVTACALALVMLTALASCTVTAPEMVSGYVTPTPTPAPTPIPSPIITLEPAATTSQDQDNTTPEPIAPTATDAANDQPDPQPADAVTAFAARASKVEIFYPGMSSMMGFVDAPITTIYENTMEAIAASVSMRWPGAQVTTYRYNREIDKAYMQMPREVLLASLVEPSFFRETPMNEQPIRIKPEDGALRVRTGDAEKMNEPIASFYEQTDRLIPAVTGTASGTVVALNAVDADALTIIVSDLHELRSDDGTLIAALSQSAFRIGRSIGILAVMSEFAGYVPDIGANKTSFVWGAPPTGTLDYTLDFTDYKVGISIDPQTRATKPRPFYVICIGEQSAVRETLTTLSERLDREFSGNPNFEQKMALYGNDYVPEGYSLEGHMRYAGGQGVTALADPNAPGGLTRVELKTSGTQRYLEWSVDYQTSPSDPRAGKFTAEDFMFVASVRDDNRDIALNNLTWSVAQSAPASVTLSLRLEFPNGTPPRGNYRLSVSGSLVAPTELPGTDWLDRFGWDPDGADMLRVEQSQAAFDGSRTLYLSRLFNALGQAHLARVGNTPLGVVVIDFAVFA